MWNKILAVLTSIGAVFSAIFFVLFKEAKEQFNDLKKVKCYPVRYVYNGRGHWVVVDNGKIVFNSLINSQCVTKGKPDTKDNTRVIKLAR